MSLWASYMGRGQTRRWASEIQRVTTSLHEASETDPDHSELSAGRKLTHWALASRASIARSEPACQTKITCRTCHKYYWIHAERNVGRDFPELA